MQSLLRGFAVSPVDGSPHLRSVPARVLKTIVRGACLRWPRTQRPNRLPVTFASANACGSISLVAVYALTAVLVLELSSSVLAETAVPALDSRSLSSLDVDPYTAFVAEASRRFAIPERWIRAVVQVESSGNVGAVSSRGALGLMQIMPQTWVHLSIRYKLGVDPFGPRDNILAGTAYLREMLDRFGSEGFLAAYNAGPGRYEAHLATGRPLPRETQVYVARLAGLIGITRDEYATLAPRRTLPGRQAALIFDRADGASVKARSTSALHSMNSSKDLSNLGMLAFVPGATRLFVQRSTESESR
ncbi:lytic transglycosylase domain-containing protein [Bradyrhizobium sp. CCGUVB14]|uniref:lytic transglycosylase domain-containing protein n=1 Tax=Bradyrhizobium sp. CCGUVB14 TaxID=2949628 RepID=UPI0020B323C1|nr:lytic transglycosylase domain-containing protein [Bradyrhizobium sp. CCGUVB14]MCP3440919.1 lytic transglycosylase domain-containing protein [Bradyrhizobium sp. CCGUVB14]